MDELNQIIANSAIPPATAPSPQIETDVPLGFVDMLGTEYTVMSEQETIDSDFPLDNQLNSSQSVSVFEQVTTDQSATIDSVFCDYCDPDPDPEPAPTPTPIASPSPTPTPTPTTTFSPIGTLDAVNGAGTASGWSLDPDNPNTSNPVEFYIGGPPGVGTFIGYVFANKPRPDVNTVTGYPGNHGFEFQIPSQYLNGQQQVLYARGMDTGSNSPTILNGSPKNFTVTPTPTPSVDEDLDGLDDAFESALADGFMPLYHVSGGEKAGTGFATFNDSAPETVKQSFPAVPPISHYRVAPLRFVVMPDGIQYGLIQIDYLTLWNRDDGLQINSLCSTGLNVGLNLAGYAISDFLDGLETHELDNERSIILVAAPVSSNSTFSPSAASYKALKFFTAAHESTYLDHSLVFTPDQPIAFGNHIELWFSRAKHATYPFNPNFFPLIPRYVISAAYSALYDYYIYGQIGYLKFLTYLYLMDLAFFTCVVEHFQEQGGVFAANRINVGELTHPINGSGFILDPSLVNKLSRVF